MAATQQSQDPIRRLNRAQTLMARLRQRQLRLAHCGKVIESETYARRAMRVRQSAGV